MTYSAEDDWGQWVMARCAIAFALEEGVRQAAAEDDVIWSLDTDFARESLERLGDALDAAVRAIAERPPPATLQAMRDALVAYLDWRIAANDQMLAASETRGWDGARAALAQNQALGEALYDGFLEQLEAVERRRR